MSNETRWAHGRLFTRLPLAAGLVAAGALAGGGVVWASGSASSEISACVEPRTGYLVYGRSCGGESLVLSQQGPQGLQGPAGPQGAPGAKGDTGRGFEPPTAAEIQVRNDPPKGLEAAAGKPNLAKLAKVKPSLAAGGIWAFSAFHDEEVSLTSIKDAFNPKEAAHLDVPAGKYVVVAKVDSLSEDYDLLGFVVCTLVAGVDTDTASTRGDSTLALTVVHGFEDPARIVLRCVGFGSLLRHAKITALRVDVLKNVHVTPG
jgi:hypothetical protein